MAITKRIATLSAALVADISGYEQGMQKAARTTKDTEGKISASMSKLEKVGLKFGLGLVGGGGALAMLTSEIRHVIDNIEKIPGVPASTIASVQQARYAFQEARIGVDQALAGVISFTSWTARAAGFVSGALVYGLDDAERAYWEFGRAAQAAAGAQERQAAAAKAAAAENAAAARVIAYAQGLQDKQITDGNQAIERVQRAREAYDRRNETDAERMSRLRQEGNAALNSTIGNGKLGSAENLNAQAKAFDQLTEAAKIEKELTEVAKDHLKVWEETFAVINDAGITQAMENNRQYAEEMKDSIVYFADGINNAFEESIVQGKDLGDVVKDLGNSIISTFLKLSVINPLMNSIFGGAKGWEALPTMFAGFFADGGTLKAGQWGIAGENGPEPIFGGSTGMTVLPNKAAQSSGGGSTFYIDARGADRTGLARLEAMIRQVNGSIEHRALGAMMDFRQRGASAF
jgi:hypothetical protein